MHLADFLDKIFIMANQYGTPLKAYRTDYH